MGGRVSGGEGRRGEASGRADELITQSFEARLKALPCSPAGAATHEASIGCASANSICDRIRSDRMLALSSSSFILLATMDRGTSAGNSNGAPAGL